MSTIYTINVTNNSNSLQDFFFFQTPAIYTGGADIYSNSLYHAALQPFRQSGTVLTFQMNKQYFAGAQAQSSPPAIGQVAGELTSSQPVDLTSASGATTNNMVNMTVDPSLGLSPSQPLAGVQKGAFRIIAPVYNPNVSGNFNIGSAIQTTNGSPAIVSNFVVAQPNQFVDCQPVLIFHVQTGVYEAGQVINFTTASNSAANCDTTTGHTTFNVTYNVDGTWATDPQ